MSDYPTECRGTPRQLSLPGQGRDPVDLSKKSGATDPAVVTAPSGTGGTQRDPLEQLLASALPPGRLTITVEEWDLHQSLEPVGEIDPHSKARKWQVRVGQAARVG
jgi:hypothetical protein